MASFSDGEWDGSASNYKDTDAYCAACLIDLNKPGEKKTQDNCKLPVKSASGDYNKSALSAAAAALAGARGGVQAPAADKAKAARALKRLYAQAQMDAPDSLKRMG